MDVVVESVNSGVELEEDVVENVVDVDEERRGRAWGILDERYICHNDLKQDLTSLRLDRAGAALRSLVQPQSKHAQATRRDPSQAAALVGLRS